ncbi:endolytic transglycosylase MltG [Aliamphritea ceti]|uniref:endolytic transglycosylase MltG n=1 Tax=Aliamphritea ceti TaxID=1524258 RepID=UPI0021C468D8|nr:endolytic transglycosylase MltG [Aliamphritea ceti]
MLRKIAISFLLTLTVVALVAYFGWRSLNDYLDSPLQLEQSEVVLVKSGSSFPKVGRELAERGLLSKPDWMAFYVRMQKVGHRLKAGEFLLEPGVTPRQLVTQLIEGKSISYRFSLIEGSTFKQLRMRLSESDVLIHETDTMTDEQLMTALGMEGEHPEGRFLANTYQFQRGMSDLDLLRRAHKLQQKVLAEEWQARAETFEKKALPYKAPYQALIMASIVEKETGLSAERPVIAGVFVRRMQIGMRLQTDPTVIYGMGDKYKGNIRRKDLRKPTAYNTYTIPGLPPTPIAMVGREAIRAALNPEGEKWLYFVAKGDGSHQFSATLKQHNKAVREYQLKRKAAYRSSPE